MATPRRALGDVRNQVLGTPHQQSLRKTNQFQEPIKTPFNNRSVHRPTLSKSKSQSNFLSFAGDNFEIFSDDKSALKSSESESNILDKEDNGLSTKMSSFQFSQPKQLDFESLSYDGVDNSAEDSDYEPIESFDVCAEPPDRFEDILDRYKEIEKIILLDDFSCSEGSFDLCCSCDFDEDFDLDSITIKDE